MNITREIIDITNLLLPQKSKYNTDLPSEQIEYLELRVWGLVNLAVGLVLGTQASTKQIKKLVDKMEKQK